MGRRYEKLLFTCAADLERNRLVTITKSTGIVAYSTYGDVGDGWLPERAETDGGGAAVVPLGQLYSNMLLKLQTASVKGSPVFAGVDGKVCGTLTATVISKSVYTQPTGSQGDIYIVPSPATTWTSPGQMTAGQIATKGASAWAAVSAVAGDVVYVTDEKRYYICSAANTWVLAKIIGYANEAGIAGDEVEVYNARAIARILPEQMPNGICGGVVVKDQITVTGSATTATLLNTRIVAATDFALASVVSASGVAPATLKTVLTDGSVVVTITGPGGSDTTVINIVVFRLFATA
jgi:formylmethanofuran dehydrogenase subunit D